MVIVSARIRRFSVASSCSWSFSHTTTTLTERGFLILAMIYDCRLETAGSCGMSNIIRASASVPNAVAEVAETMPDSPRLGTRWIASFCQ